MATTSARRNAGADTRTAGGKITRNRRTHAPPRTPYARPSPAEEQPVEEDVENPNWLSSLIYPAKVIASGAGKILSFFGNDSSSSSGDDSEDEEDQVDEVENGGSDKVSSPTIKSDNKRKIEELVLEATFSRKEGEQLIRLIKSRMVDTSRTFGERTPPARNTAIMEARKWLQEKKSGSKKKFEAELDQTSSQFTRSEKGSPEDMAKLYMKNRPAWASPSLRNVEQGSPSTLGMLHSKDETPMSTLRSSELKRSALAAGSWNLLDEIRRVRTKATEELLASTPLTKTRLSLFSPVVDQDIEEAGPAGSTLVRPDHVLHDAVASSFLRDSEDGNAVQSAEHQEHPEAVDVPDLKYNKDNEANELKSTPAENGSVLSGAQEEPRPLEEENGNLAGSSQGGQEDVHMEDPNILAEPIDIPCTTATENVLNGSQNSSSIHEEDPSQDFSQPTPDAAPAKVKETQKERKSRAPTRRGRGRGK